MTETRSITDLGIRALAAFVAEHRPDWQAPGIVAALRAERDGDVWQLAQRMIRRATDEANTTPRLQPFDEALTVGCRSHQGAPTRTDGSCSVCFVDRHADDSGQMRDRGGVPPSPEARAAMLAAISTQHEIRPNKRGPLPPSEARESARAEIEAARKAAVGETA